jgi:hypothetical protein
MNTIVSIDPGQARDPFAISVVEAHLHTGTRLLADTGMTLEDFQLTYRVRMLERILGKSYPECVKRVVDIIMQLGEAMEGERRRVHLVADITGVGRPIRDYIKREFSARAADTPVTMKPAWLQIHGGDSVEFSEGVLRVPKRDLVTASVVAMESDRVKLPLRLPLRKEFLEEMRNFRAKISLKTNHDSYEHWRETDRDDMVLAVAGAIWYAEGFLKPQSRTRKPREDEEELYAASPHPEPAGYTLITGTPLPPLPARDRGNA